MASPQDCALLANAVYAGPLADVKTPGWTKIRESNVDPGNKGSVNGYFGAAYRNDKTGEIVIANRGSRLTAEGFEQDWFGSDIQIARQKPEGIPPAFRDALEFARVIQAANPGVNITATGHSLGGAEAQVQAVALGLEATTFGAPGVAFAVDSTQRKEAESKVKNYVLPGDPVPHCGEHIGAVIELKPAGRTLVKWMGSVVIGGLIGGPLGLLAAAIGIATTHMMSNYASALELIKPARAPLSSAGGGRPAARLLDATIHGPPLTPGTGSPNVLIGGKPAWRGLPAAAAVALQSAQAASDATIKAAEMTTKVAQVVAAGQAGSPTGPAAAAAAAAAYTTEQAGKTSAAAALGSMMSAMKAAAVTPGGGTPDTHICPIPTPVPPHGPGFVIDGSHTVLVNGLPLCRQGDTVLEALGGPNKIAVGEFTVLIGG